MMWLYMILGAVTSLVLVTGNQVLINWLALFWIAFGVVKAGNYLFDRKEQKHV